MFLHGFFDTKSVYDGHVEHVEYQRVDPVPNLASESQVVLAAGRLHSR